jgi:hypothetical protein
MITLRSWQGEQAGRMTGSCCGPKLSGPAEIRYNSEYIIGE